jgi:hypothetical protein
LSSAFRARNVLGAMHRRRALREWLRELRMTPEERRDACAERCLEILYDAERGPAAQLGEPEDAVIEAERRRWAGPTASG